MIWEIFTVDLSLSGTITLLSSLGSNFEHDLMLGMLLSFSLITSRFFITEIVGFEGWTFTNGGAGCSWHLVFVVLCFKSFFTCVLCLLMREYTWIGTGNLGLSSIVVGDMQL
jgi:hypothetical protein